MLDFFTINTKLSITDISNYFNYYCSKKYIQNEKFLFCGHWTEKKFDIIPIKSGAQEFHSHIWGTFEDGKDGVNIHIFMFPGFLPIVLIALVSFLLPLDFSETFHIPMTVLVHYYYLFIFLIWIIFRNGIKDDKVLLYKMLNMRP